MINLFAICTPLFALTIILAILYTAYNTQNYAMLFAIFLPMGIYLGGNRLKTGLKKVK
ncbi:hypothetical protein SAMN04488034_1179 [Salinimicrobium catena]|uniref:Uncharacterized protein n=1 Tax=Salinimicrobium catena TaxID=390640 RepID=A0A1H5PGB3_9FLAO|nr:hypothetical protein SAMN04488140_1179 [Salinimicrobium catena]SEF12962.1 hypothetical protein SAMN04488034_1179 [Salinimicrobium catena]